MSISRALGAEKPATKRPRSYMEGPRGGKASCKKSKKMYLEGCFPPARARAPPPSSSGGCPLRVRDSFYISIYLYIYLSIPLYHIIICIYIYIHLSLFFEQVKLLERARRAHVCATKLQ